MSSPAADAKAASRARALVGLLGSPRNALLAGRIFGWLCVLPLLKRKLPLARLVRLMWRPPRGAARDPEREEQTIRTVARLSRTSGGNCLERSLVLYRFLSRADAGPVLVVGLARDDEIIGHTWIEVGGEPVLENRGAVAAYTEIITFGANGQATGT